MEEVGRKLLFDRLEIKPALIRLSGENNAVNIAHSRIRQGRAQRVLRRSSRHIDVQDLIPSARERHKRKFGLPALHRARKDALFAQLVETAALRAAGVGVGRLPFAQETAELVCVAERKIVDPALLDLPFREGIVARFRGGDITVQHHQMDEIVLRCAEARKQALILHRRGKRRSVHGALKLRQLHALDRLRREDVHVLRPGKRRVGRLRAVRVVVAGGDEHSRLHCAQRLRKRFQRLAIGRVAVEQVAREQHEIDAVLIHVIAKPRQQLAALAAALARLLGAQRAERAVQMEVRRVDDLHAHVFSPLMPAGRALSPCTRRPRRQSLRNTSQARRRSSRWRCSRCPPRGKPCQSV